MASLTLWLSPITANLESEVARIVKSSVNPDSYDSVSIANAREDDIKKRIEEEYDKLVRLTNPDAALHILAVAPCFEKNSAVYLQNLWNACVSVRHNLTLHVLGLCEGIAKILSVKESSGELERNQKECISRLKELSNKPEFKLTYSLIDDYASNGAPIGFTLRSLASYIGIIQITLHEDYYSVLSPSLLSAHQEDNLSLGVSSLTFPRAAAVKNLLSRGFLAALDEKGINETEVDSQKAAHEAEQILANIASRYPNLYNNSIRPLFKEKGMSEGKAVAEAADIIKDNLEDLRKEITGLLKDDSLTFPEKEAILALILGRDNENLHGFQYEHESIILDDACADPINLYIDAYNRYCKDTKWLPVRGDFEGLKIKIWDEEKQDYEDLPENHEALNPLPEIKRLKQQILNTTSFLREKKEELERLQGSENLRADAEEIKRKWQKPEGDLRDFEYKEQPLQEKYSPSPNLVLKSTVDLRNFFPAIRNQSDLGSCTSFSAASMYEAMMTRGGFDNDQYMSPGFLFFYSNVLKGRPTGGSNYHDQLEVLGKHGICRDSLYEYNTKNPEKRPSDEAVEDAKNHRVLEARQIPLRITADKSNSLKYNHTNITSALSEGYPVGISLKIYDNFGKSGAFILHPGESSGVKEDGYHAMVIAGYSEENGFYIVRNSWGEAFGDKGYCYIPFAYIDDPEYLDFACIITEITDTSDGKRQEIPTVLANFAATESEIRKAAIRNAIATVKIELQDAQNLYAEYYRYYQKLMLRLTMPKVQNDIRKEAEIGQTGKFINTEATKHELENNFVKRLKDFKKSLQNYIIYISVAVLIFGIVWYYTDSIVMMILFIVAAAFDVLLWLGYKWWVRLRRKELQEQLDNVAVNAQHQKEILLEMQIKFHVAGMWLSNFHKLSEEIGDIYDRLVSFNDTLRQWQKDYAQQVIEKENLEGIMFRHLDPTPLLGRFFDSHRNEIVSKIDLLDVFKDYQANIKDLDKSHENLRNLVSRAIEALMLDFNMAEFLMGREYPYLEPVKIGEEMDILMQVGQPSFRNPERNASSPVRMVMAKIDNRNKSTWSNTLSPFFPLRPVILSQEDPTRLILLTIHPQSIN
ncbi:MAG: hypothetical protein J1F12_00015 [Muribaculaceae bacterium]|nr:hypothetical protein [Muribaculaceae bacterium]